MADETVGPTAGATSDSTQQQDGPVAQSPLRSRLKHSGSGGKSSPTTSSSEKARAIMISIDGVIALPSDLWPLYYLSGSTVWC